jgi:non-lysosomal glucosylceramidase
MSVQERQVGSDEDRPEANIGRPRIPGAAWRRPIGLPLEHPPRPRVSMPMIDDGEWAGVPIGGLGSGSIGRTFRGDFARWHLDVGRHAFGPVPADAFSLFVGRRTADGDGFDPVRSTVLSTLRPEALTGWNWSLPVGAGTYHALFPRAWQAFEPDALGVRLIGEQLSPVIPGDYVASALPVGVFEWWIENPSDEPLRVGLMLSWQDPSAEPGTAAAAGAWHEPVVHNNAGGAILHASPGSPAHLRGTLAIAAGRERGVTVTVRTRFDATDDVELWRDFAADGRLDPVFDRTPSRDGEAIGSAVAATVDLSAGEARTVRFAVAWDLPIVEFGAGRQWWKRYTRSWGRTGERALDLARHALAEASGWRSAIEAWQDPILADPDRPDWYASALFNELYFLVDGGTFWEGGEVGGPDPEPDDVGRFALMECFDYPFYDTVDVDFYASFAVLALYPELERRGIRDLMATIPVDDPAEVTIEASGRPARRKLAWTVPHDVGGPSDDPFHRPNLYKFQDVNAWKDLGPKFVLQLWRDAIALGDDRLLADGLATVDRVLAVVAASDVDEDGLPDHAGEPDQTYDTWPMTGPSAYGGSLWLAALRAAAAMHRTLGDAEAAARYDACFARARAAFESRLWRGDYYAYDDGGRASSDSVMADQLAGQWYADVTGLGDLVDAARIATALRTVHAVNVGDFADGRLGAVNGMARDGTVDHSAEQSEEVWVGTTYALAAFMLGRGLVEEAWETARGTAAVTYERGLWFRTPEAYDRAGNYRASLYLRPLAIWAIEEAIARRRASATAAG